MKLPILTTFLTSILFFGCSNEQTKNNPAAETQPNKTMANFEYSFKVCGYFQLVRVACQLGKQFIGQTNGSYEVVSSKW